MVAAVYPSPYFVPAPAPPATVSPTAHKLRTYIVLTSKSSRGRLASFEDAGYSTASTSSSADSSAASSPAASPQRAAGKTLRIPDECLAYESYAAVASTSPTRDLRWSDISRPTAPTTVAAVPTVANGGRMLSLRARRRQMQRAASATPNDHIEAHALELCFEFLALADLQRAAAACKEFRAVVTGSARLPVALYARAWRASTTVPRAYAQLAFEPALEMLQQRARAATAPYALATRSHTTTRADATVELLNNSLLRVLTRGAVDSARGVRALPELPCARALAKRVSYFEVAMSGCGSVGVASLSDAATRRAYGYGSDEHVGWKGISCGYHGNDGDFVFNDGAAPYGGEWTPYGPSWGVRKPTAAAAKHGGDDDADDQDDEEAWPVVGCGLDLAARRVFFTLNGTFLGFAAFALPEGEYAAAVALHEFNDRAVMNAGSAPFRFDIEGFCASL